MLIQRGCSFSFSFFKKKQPLVSPLFLCHHPHPSPAHPHQMCEVKTLKKNLKKDYVNRQSEIRTGVLPAPLHILRALLSLRL